MSAWADQVENEEAANGALANNSEFPSLGEAMKEVKGPKAKPKKGTKVPLGAFLGTSGGPSGGNFQDKSLAEKAILSQLPTGPRGGPRDESAAGMGGGFRDYGGDRGAAGSRFQRDDRPQREEREPSRADAIDDWGATRTFTPGTGGGGGSRGFGGGGGGGGFGGDRAGGGGFGDRDRASDRPPREFSAADTEDSWGASRKFEPAPPRSGSGGYGDRAGGDRERSGGFGGDRGAGSGGGQPSKADAEDSWGRGGEFKPSDPASSREPRAGGFSGSRDAGRDGGGEDRWARSGSGGPSTSTGPSEPGERPRLKLAPRTAPAGGEGAAGGAEERKPASNPFGAARPREEVLKEKGVDPIKEALKLEHGEVDREETAAEKELKAEVEALAKQLADLKAAAAAAAGPAADADAAPAAEGAEGCAAAAAEGGEEGEGVQAVAAELDAKERQLLKLQAEEDDRVRFARAPPRREGGGEAARDAGAARRW